jgi:hypothetical protein
MKEKNINLLTPRRGSSTWKIRAIGCLLEWCKPTIMLVVAKKVDTRLRLREISLRLSVNMPMLALRL